MQVRQIAREIVSIVDGPADGAADHRAAQAIRELLATKTWAAQRHALLYVIKRAGMTLGNPTWARYPRTLVVLHMHCIYAWALPHLAGTQRSMGGREYVAELEHLRWVATSGHPLAERLLDLHLVGNAAAEFRHEVAGLGELNLASFDSRGPEAWLPIWGRTFLFDEGDALGTALGPLLSISFRDLWALWDSSAIPEDATCRLVVLHELRDLWRSEHQPSRYRDAKALVDRMGNHLRLADASLNHLQHGTWEAMRRRYWVPVRREVIENHLKALKLWADVQAAPIRDRVG